MENIGNFPMQHQLTSFYKGEADDLMRRANSNFKYNAFITHYLLLFLRGTQRLHEAISFCSIQA
jgi:hypothetical protein